MSATELAIGRVVRSKAGRDGAVFWLSLGRMGRMSFLPTAGSVRSSVPNAKRRIHLCVTNTVLEQGSMRSQP